MNATAEEIDSVIEKHVCRTEISGCIHVAVHDIAKAFPSFRMTVGDADEVARIIHRRQVESGESKQDLKQVEDAIQRMLFRVGCECRTATGLCQYCADAEKAGREALATLQKKCNGARK